MKCKAIQEKAKGNGEQGGGPSTACQLRLSRGQQDRSSPAPIPCPRAPNHVS